MRDVIKVGRNEKCPCGSGKKFKNCCLSLGSKNTQSPTNSAKVTWSIEKKPGKKIDTIFPPDWMEEQYQSIADGLSHRTNMSAFWEEYKSLILALESLPESMVSPEYRTTNIKKISDNLYDGDMLLATTTFFEFEIRKLYFTNIFKIKSVIASINIAFEAGNFTTAAILMRSFLEIVSFLYYFKKRCSDKSHEFRTLIIESEKIKLNTLEREKWGKRLGNLSIEFITQLTKSNFGTSYDWKTWVHDHYGEEFSQENHDVGKLNTLTAIQFMTKKTEINFEEIYDFFSEMIHPNFGSHTLVVKKRIVLDGGIASDVHFGDMDRDFEQTLWFFDCFANGGYETAKICREIIAEYSSLLQWYEEFNDLQLKLFSEKSDVKK
jgi:hypothetical protein